MNLFIYGVLVFGSILAAESSELFSLDVFSHPDEPRSGERTCAYRRTPGVCKLRSECRRPTRRICRIGLTPIVCCLDKPMAEEKPVVFPGPTEARPRPPVKPTEPTKPTTTHTEASKPRPTSAPKPRLTPQPKPPAIQEIDLTFPGCGSRSPSVPRTDRSKEANENTSRRSSRRNRLRGKRHTSDEFSRSKRQLRPVVVGGRESAPNSWPWMAAIFKKASSTAKSRFLCGASLISEQYVMSAAHCFDAENGNIDPSKFTVTLGAHDTRRGGTDYPVASVKVHQDYKSRQYYNDLSLLKLSTKVTLGSRIYPVCMPGQPRLRNRIVTRPNVTVTGWGDTAFGGVQSKVLREVSIPVVPQRECNESYSKVAKSTFPEGITDKFICAGEKKGGKDACQGDSGGPLVMETEQNKWEQLGVVSFGYGCAEAGYPGVYTRVSKFTQWIYEHTDLGKK